MGMLLASASGRFTCYCEDYFESQDALRAYVEQYYASKLFARNSLCVPTPPYQQFSHRFVVTVSSAFVQHAKVSRQQ